MNLVEVKPYTMIYVIPIQPKALLVYAHDAYKRPNPKLMNVGFDVRLRAYGLGLQDIRFFPKCAGLR